VFVAGPSTSTRPELNLVERIWLYLKERYLSHRLYNDYEAIVGNDPGVLDLRCVGVGCCVGSI
jgi:hypothetical protein